MATGSSSNENQQSFSMKMTTYGIQKKFPRVKHLTCEEFQELNCEKSTNKLILDCRQVEEYSVSHIADAIRVDPESPEPWYNGVDLSSVQTVVCYCSIGYRSSIVADKLTQHLHSQGRTNIKVYNLEGGVFQWAIEGRSLEGEDKGRVHPYNSFWGKLLPSDLRHRL